MNISQIEYIIAVHNTKSFTKASEVCNITQSTLSTMISKFEDEIEMLIFDRSFKPVKTTKEGKKLIKQLEKISYELHRFNEIKKGVQKRISGIVEIGVIPTVAPYLLPRIIDVFSEKHPKIHFKIGEFSTENIIQKILKRTIDIGIVSLPLDVKNIMEIPVYNEFLLLYDTKGVNKSEKEVFSKLDFERLLLLDKDALRSKVKNVVDLYKSKLSGSKISYNSISIDTLLKFVKNSNGVTLLPYLSSLDMSEEEHKKINRFEEPFPQRTIGFIVHKNFYQKQILNLLKKEIQTQIFPLFKHKSTL